MLRLKVIRPGLIQIGMESYLQRWQTLFSPFCSAQKSQQHYFSLFNAYAQSHRVYHNFQHIIACLEHFDQVRGELSEPLAVELAIWFHDVVYQPTSSHNETNSAEYARRCLQDLNVPASIQQRVCELILLTRHPSQPQNNDDALLLDIDLAILGAPRNLYAAYESWIRKEYRFIPGFLFRPARRKLLKQLLAGPIYHSAHFASRETIARENLQWAMQSL